MSAKTADIRPQSPDSLIAFLKLLLVGMLKKLPVKLFLAGIVALLAWILHTYLLVVTNEGFNPGNNVWLDRILALEDRVISGTLVWTLGVGLVTSIIARFMAYGVGTTMRSVVETPKSIWNWAKETGIVAIPLLFAGYFLTIIFGFVVSNNLLIIQLFLIVIGILIARHTSILLTMLRLSFSDLQRVAKRENILLFKIAWPGMYLVGVLVGLLAILPSGLLAFVCGCLGFILLLLVSIGLFVNSPTGTKGVFGRKIIIWILPPAILILFKAVNPVFADDGGWQEAGGTFSGWIQSPGAGRAVAMGILPAAGSGLGVLFGTALSSMVSILGATGLTGSPLSVRPSTESTTSVSPTAKGATPPPSRTADPQTESIEQQDSAFEWIEKAPEQPPGSKTADHQVQQFEKETGDPGNLSSRHRPEESAPTGDVLKSDRAGQDAAPVRSGEGAEGAAQAEEAATGQRDVRGAQPTTGPDPGPAASEGAGSAAESAGRATEFDQKTPTEHMTADRHRPAEPAGEGPLSDRNQPSGLDERPDTPAPDSSDGPVAGRHESNDVPATLEQSGIKAERHTPDTEGGPLASRHELDAAPDEGGAMRASRAPDDADGPSAERYTTGETVTPAGPTASRQSVEPDAPIPPAPVPGYVLDWEIVVVRTPEGSGVTAQQRFELIGHTRIGRHGNINLKLLDLKVSRQHADIDIIGSACRITDLKSSNGTFVNGRRITEPVELKHGDAIKIGDTYFVVEQKPA